MHEPSAILVLFAVAAAAWLSVVIIWRYQLAVERQGSRIRLLEGLIRGRREREEEAAEYMRTAIRRYRKPNDGVDRS